MVAVEGIPGLVQSPGLGYTMAAVKEAVSQTIVKLYVPAGMVSTGATVGLPLVFSIDSVRVPWGATVVDVVEVVEVVDVVVVELPEPAQATLKEAFTPLVLRVVLAMFEARLLKRPQALT